MSPKVLPYSFRVWFTSILLAPILFILGENFVDWIRNNVHSTTSAFAGQPMSWPTLDSVFVFYMIGFMAMIPSFFLLWVGCIFVCRRSWPVRMRKLAVAVCALLLIAATSIAFGMGLGWMWQPMIFMGLGYFLPLLGGIFFYRFPEPVVTEFEFD
jgi:hypothetical protein